MAQRIHAHHLGRDGIDRDLVRRRQDDVLDLRMHRAGTGAVAGGRAVHHREESGVDLLLDRQQVDERLVNPGVRVVPVGIEQAAERVLHRARGGRVKVALGGRQMDDVLAGEEVRNCMPLGENLVQGKQLALRTVRYPLHVIRLEVVLHRDLVVLEDGQVPVEVLALENVDDDGLVLHAHQIGVARPYEARAPSLRAATASCWRSASGSARRCCL